MKIVKTVNLYLASKYDNSRDVGAFGYRYECEKESTEFSLTYNRTTGPRMEMIGCLDALNKIFSKYGPKTIVRIHTKDVPLIKTLLRGRTLKGGENPNSDLLIRGPIERKSLNTQVVSRETLNEFDLSYSETICGDALRSVPLLTDKKDLPKATPLF